MYIYVIPYYKLIGIPSVDHNIVDHDENNPEIKRPTSHSHTNTTYYLHNLNNTNRNNTKKNSHFKQSILNKIVNWLIFIIIQFNIGFWSNIIFIYVYFYINIIMVESNMYRVYMYILSETNICLLFIKDGAKWYQLIDTQENMSIRHKGCYIYIRGWEMGIMPWIIRSPDFIWCLNLFNW